MDTLGIIEDQVLGKLCIEKLFIRKKAYMVVNELFLDGSVVSLNVGIDLRTPGVWEHVEDAISFEVFVEISQVLWPMYKSSTFATKRHGTGLPSNDASFKQRLTEEVIYNIEERVIWLSLT